MARWGFGLTRKDTIDLVSQYISDVDRKTPSKGGRPGIDWIQGFMERHEDLTNRKPEQLKKTRGKPMQKEFWIYGLNLSELHLMQAS